MIINSKYQSRNDINRLRRRNRFDELRVSASAPHCNSMYTHHARALLTRRIQRDVLLLLLLRGRRRARQMEGPRERAKVNIVVIASREPRADTWDAKAHARAPLHRAVSRPPRHGPSTVIIFNYYFGERSTSQPVRDTIINT